MCSKLSERKFSESLPVFSLLLFAVISFSTVSAYAQPFNSNDKNEELDSFMALDLKSLLQMSVITAVQKPQKIGDAPAIISVITAQDIRQFRYQSVAEALQQVPGIYCIYDFLSYNCGVRGINGGLRAYSKILKVMINGMPVSFRSDSTNYLGPELLPMSVIDRIEIIRGPASALYGANAYLGVINIITQTELSGNKGKYQIELSSLQENVGGDIEGIYQYRDEDAGFLVALRSRYEDRSGHELPDSSPRKTTYADVESDNDISKPKSFFADGYYHLKQHEFRVFAQYSELDSYAEFLDFGALTHANRIHQTSTNFRFTDHWTLNSDWAVELEFGYATGAPGSNEKLNILGDRNFPKREFEYDAVDVIAKLAYQINKTNHVSVGIDYSDDDEQLIEILSVDSETGAEVLISEPRGRQHFIDRGVFAQWLWETTDALDITLNIREDDNNLYGNETTYRAAGVYRLRDDLVLKALYGTSYKAPAALQLYAQPLIAGEIIGNPDLKPETAKTAELALQWVQSANLSVGVNLFSTSVDDKVELAPAGVNQQPQNIGEQTSWGSELEVKSTWGRHLWEWQSSYQSTDTKVRNPFDGNLETPSVMYPRWINQVSWRYSAPELGTASVQWRTVSQRRSTDSNSLYNNLVPYELDKYSVLDIGFVKRVGQFEGYFKVQNLLDEEYEEPGFVGIDVPGRGRLWRLGFSQRFE